MFASFDVRRMIEDSFKPVEIKEAEEVEELEEVEERSPSSRLTSAWPLPPPGLLAINIKLKDLKPRYSNMSA